MINNVLSVMLTLLYYTILCVYCCPFLGFYIAAGRESTAHVSTDVASFHTFTLYLCIDYSYTGFGGM